MKMSFNKILLCFAMLFAVAFFAGCSKSEPPPAPPTAEELAAAKNKAIQDLEIARGQANDNSVLAAKLWLAESEYAGKVSIIPRGDSTQQLGCPQGDGWATMKVREKSNPQNVFELKCSTYSLNVGCVLGDDFSKKPILSNQENKCSQAVPYPLPRLEVK